MFFIIKVEYFVYFATTVLRKFFIPLWSYISTDFICLNRSLSKQFTNIYWLEIH
jgi:hypothetical protein